MYFLFEVSVLRCFLLLMASLNNLVVGFSHFTPAPTSSGKLRSLRFPLGAGTRACSVQMGQMMNTRPQGKFTVSRVKVFQVLRTAGLGHRGLVSLRGRNDTIEAGLEL